jgi:Cytochrome oxidase complex assembly protein 1
VSSDDALRQARTTTKRLIAKNVLVNVQRLRMEQTPPPILRTSKPNWWTRNWKWFVPTGCLTILVLFLVFVGSIVVIVFSAIKSTDPYKDALARAKMHPAVFEALGSPIKEGFFVSGSTNVNGASGESNLSIPISGPKGKGTIYVKAAKSLGRWSYSGLVVEIQTPRNRIDLLKGPAPPNEF